MNDLYGDINEKKRAKILGITILIILEVKKKTVFRHM